MGRWVGGWVSTFFVLCARFIDGFVRTVKESWCDSGPGSSFDYGETLFFYTVV